MQPEIPIFPEDSDGSQLLISTQVNNGPKEEVKSFGSIILILLNIFRALQRILIFCPTLLIPRKKQFSVKCNTQSLDIICSLNNNTRNSNITKREKLTSRSTHHHSLDKKKDFFFQKLSMNIERFLDSDTNKNRYKGFLSLVCL